MPRAIVRVFGFHAAFAIALSGSLSAQEPATLAEAARVIDLRSFPVMPRGTVRGLRRLAGLDYAVRRPVGEAFAFQKKTLEDLGWKESPGGYVSEQMCSGTFGKDGYTVSVMVMPSSDKEFAGQAMVLLKDHGNVDAGKLPVPPGAKLLYSFPAATAFVTAEGVKPTAEALRKPFSAQGWEPYGTAGDSMFFKKNAVRLSAWPSSAPAQGGKTVIQFSSELMSVDLPAPASILDAAYADANKTLSLEVASTPEALADFYKEALGKSGWKATTEKPFKDDYQDGMIFRNEAKDFAFLKMKQVEGRLRATLQHQTQAEFNEVLELARAEDARRKAEARRRSKAETPGRENIAVSVPAEAKDVAYSSSDIKFKLDPGKASACVEKIRGQLVQAGWKSGSDRLESVAGALTLEKSAGVRLVIAYVDAGLGDAEVTITAFGAGIQTPEAR